MPCLALAPCACLLHGIATLGGAREPGTLQSWHAHSWPAALACGGGVLALKLAFTCAAACAQLALFNAWRWDAAEPPRGRLAYVTEALWRVVCCQLPARCWMLALAHVLLALGHGAAAASGQAHSLWDSRALHVATTTWDTHQLLQLSTQIAGVMMIADGLLHCCIAVGLSSHGAAADSDRSARRGLVFSLRSAVAAFAWLMLGAAWLLPVVVLALPMGDACAVPTAAHATVLLDACLQRGAHFARAAALSPRLVALVPTAQRCVAYAAGLALLSSYASGLKPRWLRSVRCARLFCFGHKQKNS